MKNTGDVLDGNSNVVIVGAGIGGLVCALALQQAGISCTIYEADTHFTSPGAGIVLSVNAMRVFDALGLTEQIKQQGRIIKQFSMASPGGRILSCHDLQSVSVQCNSCSIAIHRQALHTILVNALNPGVIVFNKRCNNVDIEHKRCMFSDGDTVEYDILIGCDGVSSQVRQAIGSLNPTRDANQICYRGVTTLTGSSYNKHQFLEIWGRGKRFGFVNIGGDTMYWYATLRKDHYSNIEAHNSKSTLMAIFAQWQLPVPRILDTQHSGTILRNDLYDRAPEGIWYKDSVVLIGDAIHPTTPNLGQGAGMAIESAWVLVESLCISTSIEKGFLRYQTLRAPRTTRITQQSRMLGKVGNLNSPMSCFLRNLAIGITPNWATNRYAEKIMRYCVVNKE